jgi:hypothetical protein
MRNAEAAQFPLSGLFLTTYMLVVFGLEIIFASARPCVSDVRTDITDSYP